MNQKDIAILRSLAQKQVAFSESSRNKEILAQWDAQAQGRRELPTVRFLVSNFGHEVIEPRLQCQSEAARALEAQLLYTLSGRELFDDDTPIAGTFDVALRCNVSPFGTQPQITHSNEKHGKGFHIDPIIEDLSGSLDIFKGGNFSIDLNTTENNEKLAGEIFGDILPVRRVMGCLPGSITNPLVHLMGMENYYCAMYDTPDELHQVMDMACRVYEHFYDYLEKEKVLLPTVGISPLAQESFAFTNELPTEHITQTTACWGFLESQESTAVSPETFGEFVFPYQDRLAKRFGLLSYGCCERVDTIFDGYLSKWNNLRKLSVSPFNNEAQVGEYLRGSRIVYYSKPRSEYITLAGSLDEDQIIACFKGIALASSGCMLEVAQREAGTIFSDIPRAKRYVQLAKQTIEKYWKP